MKKFFFFSAALLLSASMWAQAVNDKFVDAGSGLRFNVTAVGETNTVEVIGNSYKNASYTIPAAVTYESVVFAVTDIGSAFNACSSLQSITISEGVTNIGYTAFGNCTNLQSITIPASVTEIESYAFENCSGLTSVTFLGNACQENLGNHAFDGVGSSTPATLVLPNNWGDDKPVNSETTWHGGYFNYEAPSALPQMRAAVKATKRMVNGQLVIESKSLRYNAAGQEVR